MPLASSMTLERIGNVWRRSTIPDTAWSGFSNTSLSIFKIFIIQTLITIIELAKSVGSSIKVILSRRIAECISGVMRVDEMWMNYLFVNSWYFSTMHPAVINRARFVAERRNRARFPDCCHEDRRSSGMHARPSYDLGRQKHLQCLEGLIGSIPWRVPLPSASVEQPCETFSSNTCRKP